MIKLRTENDKVYTLVGFSEREVERIQKLKEELYICSNCKAVFPNNTPTLAVGVCHCMLHQKSLKTTIEKIVSVER